MGGTQTSWSTLATQDPRRSAAVDIENEYRPSAPFKTSPTDSVPQSFARGAAGGKDLDDLDEMKKKSPSGESEMTATTATAFEDAQLKLSDPDVEEETSTTYATAAAGFSKMALTGMVMGAEAAAVGYIRSKVP